MSDDTRDKRNDGRGVLVVFGVGCIEVEVVALGSADQFHSPLLRPCLDDEGLSYIQCFRLVLSSVDWDNVFLEQRHRAGNQHVRFTGRSGPNGGFI